MKEDEKGKDENTLHTIPQKPGKLLAMNKLVNVTTHEVMGNSWGQSGWGRLIKQVCTQRGAQGQAREGEGKYKIRVK